MLTKRSCPVLPLAPRWMTTCSGWASNGSWTPLCAAAKPGSSTTRASPTAGPACCGTAAKAASASSLYATSCPGTRFVRRRAFPSVETAWATDTPHHSHPRPRVLSTTAGIRLQVPAGRPWGGAHPLHLRRRVLPRIHQLQLKRRDTAAVNAAAPSSSAPARRRGWVSHRLVPAQCRLKAWPWRPVAGWRRTLAPQRAGPSERPPMRRPESERGGR